MPLVLVLTPERGVRIRVLAHCPRRKTQQHHVADRRGISGLVVCSCALGVSKSGTAVYRLAWFVTCRRHDSCRLRRSSCSTWQLVAQQVDDQEHLWHVLGIPLSAARPVLPAVRPKEELSYS